MSAAVPSRHAVRRLALARAVSVTGTAAANIALAAVLYRRTGSASWVSAALFIGFATPAVVSPLTGRLADRLDRRAVLIGSDLLAAACFAAMAAVSAPAALLALVFAAAVATAPFVPASGALLPAVIAAEDLPWANGRLSMARTIGMLIGPLVGGGLVAAAGGSFAFALDAASFCASAALIATLPRGLRAASQEPEEGGAAAGLRFLLADPVLRAMTLGFVLVDVGNGLVMPAEVALAHVFGAGSTGFGALVALWALGGLCGAPMAARVLERREEPAVILVGAAVLVGAFAVTALTPWFALALVAVVAGGASMGMVGVGEETLLQRRSPDAVRGRVYAARVAGIQLSLAAPLLFAGFVVDAAGPQAVYGIAAGLGAAGVAMLVRMRQVRA